MAFTVFVHCGALKEVRSGLNCLYFYLHLSIMYVFPPGFSQSIASRQVQPLPSVFQDAQFFTARYWYTISDCVFNNFARPKDGLSL